MLSKSEEKDDFIEIGVYFLLKSSYNRFIKTSIGVVEMKYSVEEVIKSLVKRGVRGITVCVSRQGDLFYDLNTGAKSHLHLYEDFTLEGRYDHKYTLDAYDTEDIEGILTEVFFCFRDCLHGRAYYNDDWMKLGVSLGLVEEQVKTTTAYKY